MICPICHKHEATETVTRKFNGVVVQGVVCSHCYETAFCLDQSSFFYTFIAQGDKKCKVCGRSLAEIEQSLLVGCPNCYKEFAKELQPLIKKMQGEDDGN